MEYTAEDLIAHKLERSGILVAKPKFDHDGADLLALLDVKDNAKFCRIQCKGRSLITTKTARVKIPQLYATDGFVLFIFVETGEFSLTHLYCILGKEIRDTWRMLKSDYILTLNRSNFESSLAQYIFDSNRINLIKKAIVEVNVNGEFNAMNHGGAAIVLPALRVTGGSY